MMARGPNPGSDTYQLCEFGQLTFLSVPLSFSICKTELALVPASLGEGRRQGLSVCKAAQKSVFVLCGCGNKNATGWMVQATD